MRKDKRTNEILFDASDCLKILGLGSDLNEFLSSDKGLDLISEYQKSHPNVDLFGKSGLFRKV